MKKSVDHHITPIMYVTMILLAACTSTPTTSPTIHDVPTFFPATGTKATPEQGKQVIRENARKSRSDWKNKSFEEFEASVYKEPFADGKYIVNGDTPIPNKKLLREFFEQEIQQERQPVSLQSPSKLIVNRDNGADTIWNNSKKQNISYCVSKSFGTNYNKVIAAIAAAGQAWSRVADIKYVHKPNQDNNCSSSNQQVVFDVRPVNVNGQYLARAFFPNDTRSGRNVLIDNSSFNLNPNNPLTLQGILRHELGHTLGFRHEHTRPESGACFEDSNWRPLTDYDALSVMHYPQCNGGGDFSLTLTHLDKNGAACIYDPASGFSVDPNICPDLAPTPGPQPESCTLLSESFPQQQVSQNQVRQYGPYTIQPGSRFVVFMLTNDSTGDPDLYVRFQNKPTTSSYACRPYISGANETCDLDVPLGQNKAYIMVRGYRNGKYHLVVNGVSKAP